MSSVNGATPVSQIQEQQIAEGDPRIVPLAVEPYDKE